ncbi:MAG: tripartite tricarboxylate transporter substrate binding protein [Pusillimonas sp.]
MKSIYCQLSTFILLTSSVAFAPPALSTDYPDKQVKIIAPFAPGGATDYIARLMAEQLSNRLGKPFIVENRTGAGGIIGIESALKAPADGYTLLVMSASYAVIPSLQKLNYDSINDAQPVAAIAFGPLAFVVNPEVPVNTLSELVSYAKAHPGKLTFSSAGTGNTTHVAMEAFLAETGIKMVHAPYRGMAPALMSVAAGDTQVILTDVGSAQALVAAGKVRMLAIGGDTRFSQIPDIPTVKESGFPQVLAGSWQGMFVPQGTPTAVVTKLNAEIDEILRSQEIIDTLKARYMTPIGGSPEQFGDTVKSDVAKWTKVVKDADIKLD